MFFLVFYVCYSFRVVQVIVFGKIQNDKSLSKTIGKKTTARNCLKDKLSLNISIGVSSQELDRSSRYECTKYGIYHQLFSVFSMNIFFKELLLDC